MSFFNKLTLIQKRESQKNQKIIGITIGYWKNKAKIEKLMTENLDLRKKLREKEIEQELLIKEFTNYKKRENIHTWWGKIQNWLWFKKDKNLDQKNNE